jgi:ankyrin repeat protein
LSELLFNCINISLISFLFLASKTGEKDIVEFLLSKGADVNAKDKNGMTALHYGE